MATPNLAIVHIAAAQNSPEVTVNAAMDAFDAAVNDLSTENIADADTFISQAQLAASIAFQTSGTMTADRHLSIPAGISRFFWFFNAIIGAFSVVVQVTGAPGATVTVSHAAGWVGLFSDGTNVIQLTTGSSSTPTVPNFSDNETPSGSTPGTAFTLAHTPMAGSQLLVLNGLVLTQLVDYTITGASITMTNPVGPSDNFRAWYRY